MRLSTTTLFGFCLALTLLSNADLSAQPRDTWARLYAADEDRQSKTFEDVYACDNGNYALCGEMYTGYPHSGIWFMIVNDEGETVINRHFRDSDASVWAYSIIETDDGGFVIGGKDTGPTMKPFLAKLNDQGEVVWWNAYGDARGYFRAVIELKGGGCIATGSTESGNDLQAYVVCVDADGNLEWEARYRNTIYFTSMRETDGGVIMVGYDDYIVKYNFNGELLWDESFDDVGVFYSIISSRGGFAIAGIINVPRLDGSFNHNFRLVHINGDGDVIWDRNYDLNGTMETAFSIVRTDDDGFLVVGEAIENARSGWLLRTDWTGNPIWQRHDLNEGPITILSYHSVVVDHEGAYVAVGNGYDGNHRTAQGLIVKIVPEREAPKITEWSPEVLDLTILRGDSIAFRVVAEDLQMDSLSYLWRLDDTEVSEADTVTIQFDEVGDFRVACLVADEHQADSMVWNVHVRDFFISSHTPDSLNLALRRGASQIFEIVATAHGDDPISYNWNLTDVIAGESQEISNASAAVVDFRVSSDYELEALAYRDTLSAAVTWNIAVRSCVLDFLPEQQTLTVPLDTTITFGIIPFDPADTTLRYLWLVDGDSVGGDSSVAVQFTEETGQAGRLPYAVTAIVSDSTDADTIVWNVTVVRPNSVANPVFQLSVFSFQLSPNPFNARTTIRFSLLTESAVRLTLHDLSGRTVRLLAEERFGTGEHQIALDAADLPAGLYFLRLESAGKVKIAKAVVLK
jgi:hypothetical protein